MKSYTRTLYIKKDKINKSKLVPVYCKLAVNTSESTFSTNKWVDPLRWDKTDQFRTKTRIDSELAMRTSLDALLIQLDRIEENLRYSGEPFTADIIKLKLFNKDEPHKRKSLLELFAKHQEKFIAQIMDGEKKKASLAKYNTVKIHIEDYLKTKYSTSDILLSKLDDSFLIGFHSFIKTEKKISINSSVKYVHALKSIIRFGRVEHWIDKDPFTPYKMKHEKKDPLFLTSAELKAIESKTFTCERVQTIKDLYVFSCYTSLAFSDVMKLTVNNIQEINGEKWLITKRTKTNSDSDIFLLPVAEQIIEKYSPHPDCITSGRLFPKRSNQKTNAYLKEIADMCNINKPLNFHSARHTYGTTVTIPNGVSLQAVSRQMGHGSLAMTLHYSRMQKDAIADQMRKLNEIYPAHERQLEVA